MSSNFLVVRHIVCDGTQGILVPSRLFGEQDEAQAKLFVQQQQGECEAVLKSHPAMPGQGGLEVAEFTVGQWLRGLGIQAVAYEIMPCPLSGSIMVAKPRLILPGN